MVRILEKGKMNHELAKEYSLQNVSKKYYKMIVFWSFGVFHINLNSWCICKNIVGCILNEVYSHIL